MARAFIIACLFSLSVSAQNIQYINGPSTAFSIPDVLQKAGVKRVTALFQDSRHLVWIGTENGLYRYDGTNATYQRHDPTNASTIPDNHVVTITEDKDGQIWIGTFRGVACMNAYNMQCSIYSTVRKNLAHDFDTKVFVDEADNIWCAHGRGLERLDKKKNAFETAWRNNTTYKQFGYLTCLQSYSKDSLLIGTFDGLLVINKKNFGWRRIALAKTPVTVMCLFRDEEERVWVGTWGYDLFLLSNHLQTIENFHWDNKLDGGSHILRDITKAGHHYFLSISNGILQVPLKNKNPDFANAIFYRADASYNQPFLRVISYSDTKLLTGGFDGIYSFSLTQNRFTSLPVTLRGALQEPQLIHWRNKDYLTLSSWHGGSLPVLYDTASKETITIPLSGTQKNLAPNSSTVINDKWDRLWVSTFNGIQVFDKELQLVYDFTKAKGGDTLTSRKTAGLQIFNDTIWVNCYSRGIDLFDLNFKKLAHLNIEGPPDEGPVWKIFRDKQNRTWVCGNGYFFKWLPGEKRFKRYDFSKDGTDGGVNDVAQLKNNHLVIAANVGLVDFNPADEHWFLIPRPALQKEQIVTSIAADVDDNLWYLTNEHLVYYNSKSKRFKLYSDNDGLEKGKELGWIKTFDEKTFYLTQSNDISSFTPSLWQNATAPPKIFVHNMQIGDSSLSFTNPPHSLDLKYNNTRLLVGFDGINFEKPEQNEYAYMLTPTDNKWTSSDHNYVLYNSLEPGNYVLHMKVANDAGIWSDEYLLDIHVSPPWWKTWWAIAGAFVFVTVIFYLVVRYIAQRNLKERILVLEKEQAIEKERNRIAQDMHDDLGSGLTKIAILSEVAKTQLKQSTAAVAPLEKISASSRQLVDNLQDIVWVLNPHNDTLDNLAAYIREYAVKFFENSSTQVTFEFPEIIPSVKLSEEQRRNIFLVIKETLNNTAKHSCASKLVISLQANKKKIEITISDDGKGFEKTGIRKYANGLRNMEDRIKQVGGSYSIESRPASGTTTKLVIGL